MCVRERLVIVERTYVVFITEAWSVAVFVVKPCSSTLMDFSNLKTSLRFAKMPVTWARRFKS